MIARLDVGFHANNGREFTNVEQDELTSKQGITVKCGSAFSSWSNGLNERNHISFDITIKKLKKDKKTALDDSLVRAAPCTHNTSVNNLG